MNFDGAPISLKKIRRKTPDSPASSLVPRAERVELGVVLHPLLDRAPVIQLSPEVPRRAASRS